MKKMKKLKIILLIIAIIIIAIAGASVFAAKKAHNWFQSAAFETYLQAKLKEHGNIHIAFGNRNLRFFPTPQVVIEDVDIVIDDIQRVSVENLSLAIELTSLASDTPVIDSITLNSPTVTLVLPDPFAENDPDAPFPNISELLRDYLLKAQSNVEIDELNIINGRAQISFTNSVLPEIALTNIKFNTNMRRNRLAMNLSMRGNFFEGLSFNGNADFKSGAMQGNGQITAMQLADFLPQGLFEKETVDIEDCLISAKYSLATLPTVKLDLTGLDIKGRISDGKTSAEPVFANSQLSLELDGQAIKIASQGVNGVAPRGRITADMRFDLADMEQPQIDIEIMGYNLNIKESGRFLGVLDDDAAHLFNNIVQAGVATDLRFYINCDNFDDIFRYRKFELDFTAADATINIFPIRLLLQKVNGRGVLKDGWLTISGADGAWRDSSATNCELKLDLNTDDYDFTFSSGLDFNIETLKELLVLVNPKFTNQLLDRMDSLKGRVTASLDIKYNDNKEVITVVSEKFDAAGTYKVGKLPVTIKNALFTYADTSHIEFSAANLNLGNSKAQNFSYKQDMTPAKVKAGTDQSEAKATVLDVALNQALPVITELTGENTPKFLSTWQFTSGGLVLKNFSLKGVIDNVDTWLINANVAAKDVSAFNKNFADEPFLSPDITMNVKTNGDVVTFNDINARFLFAKDNEVNITGRAQTDSDEIVLDLDISAPKIDFDLLLDVLGSSDNGDKNDDMGVITGKIDFMADTAILFERGWSPVKASVTMTRDRGYLISMDDVALCGIALKGQVNINKGQIDMRVEPWLTDGQMANVLPCLSKDLTYAEGDISVQGVVTAKGDIDRFSELLNGEFKLYSKNGHIHKMTLLANLLSIVNVTEFYKGSLPNFNEKGFDYNDLLISGTITNGKIVIDSTTIDSSFFTAVASGSIDIGKNQLSIDILVAPFKTFDRVISYIPIIGHIMGNNLVALPFRASGTIEDPAVIPLPPDAVAGSLLGVLERTLTSPVAIFDNALFDLFTNDPNAEKNPNKQPGAGEPLGEINEFNPSGQDAPTQPNEPETESPAAEKLEDAGAQNTETDDGFRSTFWGPGPKR